MKKTICIAGAGPAGLTLAAALATAGHRAIVFEKKTREAAIGYFNWPDTVDLKVLAQAGFPVPVRQRDVFVGDGVKETLPGAGLYLAKAPDPATGFILGGADCDPILIDRREQEAWQIARAEQAGAELHFEVEAVGLIGTLTGTQDEIRVTGIQVREKGEVVTYEADLVVDATGYDSVLRQQVSLPEINTPFVDEENYQTYRVVLGCMELFQDGGQLEDGEKGYAWVTPLSANYIDIGCCCGCERTHNKAKEYVERIIRRHTEQLTAEQIYGGCGYISVAGAPECLVLNGFAIAGDSAAMAVPFSGCGVSAAIRSGLELAQVIIGAESCTREALLPYEKVAIERQKRRS